MITGFAELFLKEGPGIQGTSFSQVRWEVNAVKRIILYECRRKGQCIYQNRAQHVSMTNRKTG